MANTKVIKFDDPEGVSMDLSRTIARTIHIKVPQEYIGPEVHDCRQEAIFTREAYADTDGEEKIRMGEWHSDNPYWTEFDAPNLPGYKADRNIVPSKDVSVDDEPQDITITYSEDDESKGPKDFKNSKSSDEISTDTKNIDTDVAESDTANAREISRSDGQDSPLFTKSGLPEPAKKHGNKLKGHLKEAKAYTVSSELSEETKKSVDSLMAKMGDSVHAGNHEKASLNERDLPSLGEIVNGVTPLKYHFIQPELLYDPDNTNEFLGETARKLLKQIGIVGSMKYNGKKLETKYFDDRDL